MQISYTRPSQCPKLAALAEGCNNGACNVHGIVNSLHEALRELQPMESSSHPAVKVIIGQLSYLLGESIGPNAEAWTAWMEWMEWDNH